MPPARIKSKRNNGKTVKDVKDTVKREDDESVEENSDNNDENNNKRSACSAEDPVWVRCNDCDKWRKLPPSVDSSELPDIWTCNLNSYDKDRNCCEAPEEPYKQSDVPLRTFLKVWAKKLRCADRAESKLPPSAVTRGRNKRSRNEIEWIKCSNPSCGKWRQCLSTLDTSALLRKMNNNRWSNENSKWFCSMNSWDETVASCAAPQDPLYDCLWNIGLSNSTVAES